MTRWLLVALLLVPAAALAEVVGLPPIAVFAIAIAGTVPAAALIGQATEALAVHFGPRVGGFLNATFGNAVELLITLFAIHDGLLTLVKASITGSIIGNTLLSLGLSLLVGGIRHGRQRFQARQTSVNAAMMILAVAGLYLPATFATAVQNGTVLEEMSLFVAGVLLLTYVAYLLHSFVDREGHGHRGSTASSEARGAAAEVDESEATTGGPHTARWSVRTSALVLGLATVSAAVAGEVLTGSIEPVTRGLGWSEFFVGVVVVATVGNVAEYASAVRMALRNRLNVTLSIAAGSSTQVALFVAPILVLFSPLLGRELTLIFTPLELAIIGLATAIFAYVSLDGESNWLEGVQLLGVYAVAAIAFFFLPVVEA